MPKVSIVVVTYNHARVIDQALESVYQQETGFPVEVIISEDASTDGTREIVERWAQRRADVTRLLLSERNLHSNEPIRRGFHAASGQYVALLDGDDYWLSPHKLAAQVEVLDADSTLALCFHNARVYEGATRFGELWSDPHLKPRLTLADLWEGNPFPTCGGMFRRSAAPRIPEWYANLDLMITDWPLYLLFAEQGDIAFMPEALGVYRLHAGGVYSPRSAQQKLDSTDRLYRRVNEGMAFRHDGPLRYGHFRYFVDMARAYLETNQRDLARLCLGYAHGYGAPGGVAGRWEAATLALRSAIPWRFAA